MKVSLLVQTAGVLQQLLRSPIGDADYWLETNLNYLFHIVLKTAFIMNPFAFLLRSSLSKSAFNTFTLLAF